MVNVSSEELSFQKLRFDDVVGRFRDALGLSSDADVARALGLSTGDFANRKRRGTLPLEKLAAAALSRNVSVDWLLTGRAGEASVEPGGRARSGYPTEAGPLDVELLETVLSAMRHELSSRRITLSPAREARVAALLYEHFSGRKADKAAFSRFLDVVFDR